MHFCESEAKGRKEQLFEGSLDVLREGCLIVVFYLL